MFSVFAALAIFVACLGLFGLSSFSTTQRTKEIGIRKSLGATIPNIVLLLSREFILLIILANFIAWPLTYFIMDAWLDGFANRIGLDLSIFLFSALCVVLVAIVTVGYKTVSTARSNPVKALRYE